MMVLLIAPNYEVRLVAELQSSRFDETTRFNIQGSVAEISSFKLAKLDQKIQIGRASCRERVFALV